MDAELWANIIAGTAFVVAVASAGFAWKSAKEANLANRISIHEYQRKLYEVFADTFLHLQLEGQHTSPGEFARLGVHIKTSRLYVGEQISKKLQEFADAYEGLCNGACHLTRAYEESADTSKRFLEGGGVDRFAQALSEKANNIAEQSELDVLAAVSNVLRIGAELDKIFIEKMKLV
ncbi:hypothetical protein ACEN2T_14965 [Pseudomonas sp. W22_MBD1_FP4]|uniref:hypothetical protein n=1 Tax=Pseudomonas sp. W22_MBD1_FP4 TaxID=3240272 RepID=UPI003F94D525